MRLTQTIPLSEITGSEAKKEALACQKGVKIGPKQVWFNRFVKKMEFSKDDKQISIIMVNGPKEQHVMVYDFLEKKPRPVASHKFTSTVSAATFMPRDPSKLLLAGDGCFLLYQLGRGAMQVQSEYEGVP